MRKLIALAAVAAVAGIVAVTPTASANCSTGPTTDGTQSITNPVTGGQIYYTAPGGTSGTIGTTGSTGHIEASGTATGPDGFIQGSTADGSVNGRIDSGGICVNDTSAP